METNTELALTVRLDTSAARREISEFRMYALEVVEQIRAAYASLGPIGQPAAMPAGAEGMPAATPKRRV